MCGIVGFLDRKGSFHLQRIVNGMTKSLSHRGPDGSGQLVSENVAIGHTRLAIIDLQGGQQPMSTVDGMLHLTYNGEIYNYKTLKQELTALGHSFETNSDTEVVLKSYLAWGRHCTDKFEGMFAFAIADFKKQEVLLARDHFGIKPLLYMNSEDSFAFASEFSPFLHSPEWSGEIDLFAIDLYLRYQYIPAPYSAFRQVKKLPAGHRLIVSMNDASLRIEQYWQPSFTQKRARSRKSLLLELDRCLNDSVQRHLVADVPFGALLSGGIDSSLMVGYMSELLGKKVKTFSIGFDNADTNELEYARFVSKTYSTEHHEQILHFDAISNLAQIVKHHGEPFGDQSSIPTWAVCQLARNHVPMVISGDGGDELFAGYHWYGSWLRCAESHDQQNKATLRTTMAAIKRKLTGTKRSTFWLKDRQGLKYWNENVSRFPKPLREKLWNRDLRFLTDLRCETFDRAFSPQTPLNVNQAQIADMHTYLPENICCKVDIGSMRYGLEVRPPLLDRRVFRLAASIPANQLINFDASSGEFEGKVPLKLLCQDKLGKDFAFRKKQGFSLPLKSWIGSSSKNFPAIKDKLTSHSSRLSDWLNLKELTVQLEQMPPENLWMLLCLEEWLHQNKS